MSSQHNSSYNIIVPSGTPTQSLPQIIQNISIQNAPLTATDNNDYLPRNSCQPRDHILPAPEVLSMMAAERDGATHALFPTSFPTGISLQSNGPRDSLYESGFLTHSHSSHGEYSLAPFRHSFQPTTAYQEYAASQCLTLLDDIADRTIDSTINAASSYPAAPDVQAIPTLRRAHSLEEFSSASPLTVMSTFSRADSSVPCGGYHYTSYPFSSTSLAPSSFSMNDYEDGGYLSSSAPSTQMSYPGGHHDCTPATASTALYSSSLPPRMLSPSFSPSPSCNSPALSNYSPTLDMKRISLENLSPSDSNDSDCNSVHGGSDHRKKKKSKKSMGRPLQQEKRFACQVANCNRMFSRHYNLESHKYTHGVQRPHGCRHCPKTFARVHDRDRHMNSHMLEKPHVCIVCQSRFGRQDAVIRHLKLSNETNPCSWMLKQKGITFREAAAGRVSREQLGEETEIRQTFETLEEEARKIKATRTLESMNYGSGVAAAS
ncbi:hypothetical protein BGZ72_007770 [Mortierella alpina]|nr:hypothetical protein BGZ72_007770 [Mortierella alpina]